MFSSAAIISHNVHIRGLHWNSIWLKQREEVKFHGKAVEVLFPFQWREGDGLSKTSNYLSFSSRKSCHSAQSKKLSPFPPQWAIVLLPSSCLAFQGGAASRLCVTSGTYCQGVSALCLGKGDVWEKTRARLCLSLLDELMSPCDTVWGCACANTPCSPPAAPNQGQELRDCCPALSVLVCSGPYNILGHFWSHLCSSLCSHKIMRLSPRSSWAKGMFLLNPWEGAEIRASPHVLLLCFPEIWSNNCIVTSKIKTDSQDWLVLGDYLWFYPISSEQSSCLLISKLLLSQCCRVYIHLLWHTTGLGVLSFILLDFTWNQVKNKWCSQNQALSSQWGGWEKFPWLLMTSFFFSFWIRK